MIRNLRRISMVCLMLVLLVGVFNINAYVSDYQTIEAESYVKASSSPEIQAEATQDVGGGLNVGYIMNNRYVMYSGLDFGSVGAKAVTIRVSGASNNSTIEFRTDSLTGPIVATISVPNTGGYQIWQSVTADIVGQLVGVHDLYLIFKNTANSSYLFNINWFFFTQKSADDPLLSENFMISGRSKTNQELALNWATYNPTNSQQVTGGFLKVTWSGFEGAPRGSVVGTVSSFENYSFDTMLKINGSQAFNVIAIRQNNYSLLFESKNSDKPFTGPAVPGISIALSGDSRVGSPTSTEIAIIVQDNIKANYPAIYKVSTGVNFADDFKKLTVIDKGNTILIKVEDSVVATIVLGGLSGDVYSTGKVYNKNNNLVTGTINTTQVTEFTNMAINKGGKIAYGVRAGEMLVKSAVVKRAATNFYATEKSGVVNSNADIIKAFDDNSACAVIAIFSGDKLISCKTKIVDGNQDISFIDYSFNKSQNLGQLTAKFMLLKRLSNLCPIAKSIETEIQIIMPNIQLDKAGIMINTGGVEKLNTNISAEQGTVSWRSNNEAVATVDQSGNVTGVSEGSATITATAINGKTAQCKVAVDYQVQNPILPLDWNMWIPDGEPHVWANGKLYVYGSRDQAVSGHFCSNQYNSIYTNDLKSWTNGGISYSTIDNSEVPYPSAILWAPDTMYKNSKYYMYTWFEGGVYPSIPFVVTSDSPTGPFKGYTQIRRDDTNAIISGGDPAVFVDDDGKAYLYWGSTMAAQLTEDGMKVIASTITDTRSAMPNVFEGQSMRKIKGKYYLIYAQQSYETQKACPTNLVYCMGDSPLGPFTYKGLIISNYGYPGAGNIHGSIEPFNGQWYVFYHKPINGVWNKRSLCAEPITINEDGTINQVELTSSGVGSGLKPNLKIEAEIASKISGHCSFEDSASGNIGGIRNGDYAEYKYVDFGTGVTSFSAKVAVPGSGGNIEVRLDTPDGELVGTCIVPAAYTSGWQTYKDVTCSISSTATGKRAVYLKITGIADADLFNLDSFSFIK